MADAKDIHERAAELMRSGAIKKTAIVNGQLLVKKWPPASQPWPPAGEGDREPPRAA
jgi:hypothetical protein